LRLGIAPRDRSSKGLGAVEAEPKVIGLPCPAVAFERRGRSATNRSVRCFRGAAEPASFGGSCSSSPKVRVLRDRSAHAFTSFRRIP
jgi:hypothetical protein